MVILLNTRQYDLIIHKIIVLRPSEYSFKEKFQQSVNFEPLELYNLTLKCLPLSPAHWYCDTSPGDTLKEIFVLQLQMRYLTINSTITVKLQKLDNSGIIILPSAICFCIEYPYSLKPLSLLFLIILGKGPTYCTETSSLIIYNNLVFAQFFKILTKMKA